ncbi:MAG: hypothetical protein ACXQTS_02720 [Candidatus Methanospirareceae archaeon]
MKLPLEIQKMKDPDGLYRFKAITSFQEAITQPRIDEKLVKIQKEYERFIFDCKKMIEKIRSGRKFMSDSTLQWKLADKIYSFIKWIEDDGFVFANVSEAISRDTGLSKSQLNYLIKFRTYYPSMKNLHKEINWSKYREILDIRNPKVRRICEEKILNGEIKSDKDLREFKRRYREACSEP